VTYRYSVHPPLTYSLQRVKAIKPILFAVEKVGTVSFTLTYPVDTEEVGNPLHTVGFLQRFMKMFRLAENNVSCCRLYGGATPQVYLNVNVSLKHKVVCTYHFSVRWILNKQSLLANSGPISSSLLQN
jgi:hypothetical protein